MTKRSKDTNNLLFKILEKPDFDKLQRNILASNPRVTKFKINWDGASSSTTENGTSQQVRK